MFPKFWGGLVNGCKSGAGVAPTWPQISKIHRTLGKHPQGCPLEWPTSPVIISQLVQPWLTSVAMPWRAVGKTEMSVLQGLGDVTRQP